MSAQPPRHVPIQFDVVDDCLVVGGIALTRLAAQVGQTPFYAYDRGQIDARVAALRDAMIDQLTTPRPARPRRTKGTSHERA